MGEIFFNGPWGANFFQGSNRGGSNGQISFFGIGRGPEFVCKMRGQKKEAKLLA